MNREIARDQTIRLEVDVLVDTLDLPESWLHTAVGKHEPIEIEVAARWHTTRPIVAAVGPVRRAVPVVLDETLINPVPDKTTGEDVVIVNHVPVLAEIARAVAHRVRVFDQYKGTIVVRLRVLLEIPVTPVHAGEKVRVSFAYLFDIAFSFILNRTRQVA